MAMENQEGSSQAHVLVFPLSVQGHIKPMLNLAELLCIANVKVTFLITAQNLQRLTQYADVQSRFAGYPGFGFKVVPDRAVEKQPTAESLKEWLGELVRGLALTAEPLLRDMMVDGLANVSPVTCLIVDGWLTFANDVAYEAQVPVIAFRCPSASCFWTYFCTPTLIDAGEIPFQDEEMDELVRNVPGMNTFLRYRDLPSFCRNQDKTTSQGLRQLYDAEIQRTQQVYGLIVNTFEDLEAPVLSQIRSKCSRVYPIGPLHIHIKHRVDHSEQKTSCSSNSSGSLWEVDKSCISWLDEKPDRSVLHVSFGSLTVMTREQNLEIWSGLVQSGKFFLWVVRSDLTYGNEQDYETPVELSEGTEARGCIVRWCPQEEVLSHRAIGGFLTHSGWNSTLESIAAGVPMLCWPYFADQQVNSRMVSEVWRVGLDMKDMCDRNVVEKLINDLMENKRDELEMSAVIMSDLARKSVEEGGSSYCNLDNLIQDIKLMSVRHAH